MLQTYKSVSFINSLIENFIPNLSTLADMGNNFKAHWSTSNSIMEIPQKK